jgi:hypothetical protein
MLQEIQLGQKRCHGLELRIVVSPLHNVVSHKAGNSQGEKISAEKLSEEVWRVFVWMTYLG